jgi:hypothetical protein
MTKSVAKTEDQMPDYIKQGQNRGNENVSNDDLQLPRIDVLQALSPQTQKKKDEYIDGAEAGMLFNTLTGELYPDGVNITPISFVKRHLVWVDRQKDSEGGLRGVFDSSDEAERFVEAQEDEDKLEVVPTAEHLVLLDDGTEVILSMAKSKMKVSRKFNSLVRLNGGDRFSRKYLVTSVSDKSAQGEFENIAIANAGYPSKEVYEKAETLFEAISSGSKKQASGNYDEASTGQEY